MLADMFTLHQYTEARGGVLKEVDALNRDETQFTIPFYAVPPIVVPVMERAQQSPRLSCQIRDQFL